MTWNRPLQVGVSVEPLAELAQKEGSKLGAKEVRAHRSTRLISQSEAGLRLQGMLLTSCKEQGGWAAVG